MLSFYATGLVYFVWPVLIFTLLFEYLWDLLALTVSFRLFPLEDGIKPIIRKHFFAVFVTSFGCNALLVVFILILEIIGQGNETFAAWLENPFSGMEATLLALLCILLVLATGLLKHVLYRKLVFKRPAVKTETLQKSLFILTLMTTPWLYLLPTKWAAGWLGELMIALGSLAGYSTDESVVDEVLGLTEGA